MKLNNTTILTDSVAGGANNSFKQYEFNAKNGDVLDIQYNASNQAYLLAQLTLIAK